ncbi:MAG TPA: helix-turn-helix domain-containing GNAT family N-acetyltransferase [Myxococcales bacterium]|nr:helix-turn-helix domain-containing GNAT family N-acetyltransferase [Myxococcales bacterium]
MARAAAVSGLDPYVAAVRHFNRFYTRKIGVLKEGLLDSSLSLTEARVLYELCNRSGCAATDLRAVLGLDRGYLSRILRTFEERGWLERKPAEADARRHVLAVTRSGRAAFESLNARSDEEMRRLLGGIGRDGLDRLRQAMRTVEGVLEPEDPRATPYLLRTHRPGDLGWVVYRHGVLYSEEWGYDERFEALVAQIAAEFVQSFDPAGERCWIAEKDGERAGSVFLVRKSKRVAKLRLLLVEPSARGLGIGKRLVDECVRFARQCRYRKLVLWTQSELRAARRIYQQAGFRLAATERHRSWGRDNLVAESWELDL